MTRSELLAVMVGGMANIAGAVLVAYIGMLGGDGKPWRIGTEVYGDRDILPRDVISRKLSVPNAERIFFIRHALRAGFTIEEIFNLTKIDRWFLVQIKEIVDFEEELASSKN